MEIDFMTLNILKLDFFHIPFIHIPFIHYKLKGITTKTCSGEKINLM